jgi:hypothetical protein
MLNKQKFDYYWKIALIIILIFGMAYMFWEFNQINKKGLECHSAPFDYGIREAEKQGITCFYDCFKSNEGFIPTQKIDLNSP